MTMSPSRKKSTLYAIRYKHGATHDLPGLELVIDFDSLVQRELSGLGVDSSQPIRLVQSVRLRSNCRMKSFVASSVRFPEASNRSEALPIITSGWLTGNMLRKTIICRR